MTGDNGGFGERVQTLVSGIPQGKVMTYGQIAAICGNARAARIVGGLAHYGDPKIPWHRVVNKKGGLASGYPGGRVCHKNALESDGVKVYGELNEWFVNINEVLWQPNL